MTGNGADGGEPGGDRGARDDGSPELQAARTLTGYLALAAALVLHVMVGALLPLTPQLAPRWMLAVSVAAWIGGAVLIWRWHRVRPIVTMLVPFAVLGAWFVALRLGAAVLGWGS